MYAGALVDTSLADSLVVADNSLFNSTKMKKYVMDFDNIGESIRFDLRRMAIYHLDP